jgi:hypothetical protein
LQRKSNIGGMQNRFHSTREAKEFLVSQIVEQAQHDNVVLSEVERKMLFYTESGWTLPDIESVQEEFDRDYDQTRYERKIARLIKHAYRHDLKLPDQYDSWWSAIHLLQKQDHYILVMIRQAGLRPRWDQLKLLASAIGLIGLFASVIALRIFLDKKYGANFGRFSISRDAVAFYLWAFPICIVVAFFILRFLLGSKRFDYFVSSSIERILKIVAR